MWIVKGITQSGKEVRYNIPQPKDTSEGIILALAFQLHGSTNNEDPLTTTAEAYWTSDCVERIPAFLVKKRENFAIEIKTSDGNWQRHSTRAFRSQNAAEEALETAATANADRKFRILRTSFDESVVAVSRSAADEAPEQEPNGEASEQEPKGDVPSDAQEGAPEETRNEAEPLTAADAEEKESTAKPSRTRKAVPPKAA